MRPRACRMVVALSKCWLVCTIRSLLLFEVCNLEFDALDLLSLLTDLADSDLDAHDSFLGLELADFDLLRVACVDTHVVSLDPIGHDLALLVNILQLAEHVTVVAKELDFDVGAESARS